ncbi:MAG: hypothetical protein ABSE45_10815 [Candidatus Acidiferrales bacterium]|jgi:hypothetical protein
MKGTFLTSAALVAILALCVFGTKSTVSRAATPGAAAAPASAGCTPPTSVGANVQETAWKLFVAATCPVNSNKYPYVVWENWIEQSQLYTSSGEPMLLERGQRPRFHMSPLARIMQERARGTREIRPEQLMPESANQDCNSNTWSKRTICEEARLNPSAQNYVTANKLTTKQGQIQFAKAGKTFDFAKPGVEVKVDWIQLSTCTNPPTGVHVENVNGTCYALGGMHLISKLIDKWIWATFEPQNNFTNPQRCVVLGCDDPWGSLPPKTSGSPTNRTPALVALMKSAGLAPEWGNYRLDGVQTEFVAGGKPTVLGNSIIEGDNAGNPTLMKSASCITCHDLSTINQQGQGLSPDFVIGAPAPLPPGQEYVRRDFVWSLALAQ